MSHPNPIPAAPGGESEAPSMVGGAPFLGVSSLNSRPGACLYCPADFSEIDGEDYDAKLDAYLSWQAAIAALREVYLRDPNAPELRRGRW